MLPCLDFIFRLPTTTGMPGARHTAPRPLPSRNAAFCSARPPPTPTSPASAPTTPSQKSRCFLYPTPPSCSWGKGNAGVFVFQNNLGTSLTLTSQLPQSSTLAPIGSGTDRLHYTHIFPGSNSRLQSNAQAPTSTPLGSKSRLQRPDSRTHTLSCLSSSTF